MTRKIINSLPRYKEFRALIDGGDYVAAVRSGLDFLRFVGEEYIRKEVFMHQKYDGDDFFAREVEELLANVLRNQKTPLEDVELAKSEIAEIEKMEAYDDYCLSFFDNVHEAIDFRLADAEEYLAVIDKQIAMHTPEYKRDVASGTFEYMNALASYDALDDLLTKKMDYLYSVGKDEEVMRVVREYMYMPSVASVWVNGLMQQGRDDEAIAAIDEVLKVYRVDGYTVTCQLHLKKALLLERKGDMKGVAEEYRRVFRQHLSNKRMCMERLKVIVPKEEWDEFAVKMFEDIPNITDGDCALVCDMIVEEKQYTCLLKILTQNRHSFKRVELFKKYAPYMSKDDQRAFAELVIDDLRQRLQYAKSGDYGYIVDELSELLDAGTEANILALAFMQEILVKYRNRPALIRSLVEKIGDYGK